MKGKGLSGITHTSRKQDMIGATLYAVLITKKDEPSQRSDTVPCDVLGESLYGNRVLNFA